VKLYRVGEPGDHRFGESTVNWKGASEDPVCEEPSRFISTGTEVPDELCTVTLTKELQSVICC